MEKSFDYEKSVKRLEEIVELLKKSDITLEERIKLFEEGSRLAAECSKALDEAEMKITNLSGGDL